MYQLIEEQMESDMSQVEFCKKQNLSIATFNYWRKKYLTNNSPPSADNFVALKIQTIQKNNHPLEIQLPNKIVLRCKNWQTDQLSSLISELQNIELRC